MTTPAGRSRACLPALARWAGACSGVVVLGAARLAQATPQWSASADPAVCVQGSDGRDRVAFCGALHGDVIFGRQRERDAGLGPYLTLGTVAFDDLRLAAGGSFLVPTWEDLALVVSAGGLADHRGSPGVDGSVFFGVRSYNFHGSYNFGAGLVVDAERTFGDEGSTVLSLGLRVDGLAVALPFLLAWGALQ